VLFARFAVGSIVSVDPEYESLVLLAASKVSTALTSERLCDFRNRLVIGISRNLILVILLHEGAMWIGI
jgi:hypothetical protein